MVLWVKKAPTKDDSPDYSKCEFVDRYITCAIPDSKQDVKLHELITNLQKHKHTQTCRKRIQNVDSIIQSCHLCQQQ